MAGPGPPTPRRLSAPTPNLVETRQRRSTLPLLVRLLQQVENRFGRLSLTEESAKIILL